MMLANDLKTYYDEVRRYLDCPKDEQDRLLLSVNKQVIELQVDNPNLDQEEKTSSSHECYRLYCCHCNCFIYGSHLHYQHSI